MTDQNRKKRPRDPNELAKLVVDLATMDDEERKALLKEREAQKSRTQSKRGSVTSSTSAADRRKTS